MAAALFLISALAAGSARAAARSRDPRATPAGRYILDTEHASVVVRVFHMGFSRYTMRFDRLSGEFTWDPAHPDTATTAIEIDAASLDAGAPELGPRFAETFLDAAAHPKITFISRSLVQNDDGTGTLTGALTLRGVTHPVVLHVVFNGVGPGLIGGRRTGFSGSGHIRRSEFGSTAYLPDLVGDDVDIEVEVEFYKK